MLKKRESNHFLETLETLEILDICLLKRIPFVMTPFSVPEYGHGRFGANVPARARWARERASIAEVPSYSWELRMCSLLCEHFGGWWGLKLKFDDELLTKILNRI